MKGDKMNHEGGVSLDEEVIVDGRICPNWKVIIFNTDYHTMPFVVLVLVEIFRLDHQEAINKMMEIHETGQSIITVCSKERAELYVEQVISVGGDKFSLDERAKNHLPITMEPDE